MDEAEHCRSLAFIYQGRLIASGRPSVLKANLHGCLVEVHVAPDALVSTLNVLRTYPQASEVALFGTAIHVTLSSPDAMPGLGALLQASNLRHAGIEAIVPSLEDVFVSLVTQEAEA
jgi:ABC-2 type transport system ATP-binding protein